MASWSGGCSEMIGACQRKDQKLGGVVDLKAGGS